MSLVLVVSTQSLEASKELNAPVIIQFSNGGAVYNAGKGLDNSNQAAAIAGAIAGAKHVHTMSDSLWSSFNSTY